MQINFHFFGVCLGNFFVLNRHNLFICSNPKYLFSFESVDCEADKEATQAQLNKLAKLIQSNWEEVASSLAPDLFTSSHMNVIRQENAKRKLQAQDMLQKWSSSLGIKSHRRLLIEALIREDQRYQANDVFGVDLVNQVCPQKDVKLS